MKTPNRQLELFQVKSPAGLNASEATELAERAAEIFAEYDQIVELLHSAGYKIIVGGVTYNGEPIPNGGTYMRCWRVEGGRCVERIAESNHESR